MPIHKVELTQAEKWTIEAQNRTTYAIRALVRFILIQFLSITIGAVIYGIAIALQGTENCERYGNCGISWFLLFVGSVIIILGVIKSIHAGWTELAQSEVPIYKNVWVKETN